MDAKVFKTFLEVSKVKHFGKAAENLYLTQAAVSARIKQLESHFETTLFTRDRNNIRLTSSGERLVHFAEIIVSTLHQAKLELSLDGEKIQQIKIAGTPNIWDAFLQTELNKLTTNLPRYSFIAEMQSKEQLYRHLQDNTLDIAFAFDYIRGDGLECIEIAEIELALTSTNQYSLERYVYVDWGVKFAQEHDALHSKNLTPYLRTSTARIALDFILNMQGCAYLPLSITKAHIDNNQLFLADNVSTWHRPLYLIYKKKNASIDVINKIQNILLTENQR